jgi:hypothetical protein
VTGGNRLDDDRRSLLYAIASRRYVIKDSMERLRALTDQDANVAIGGGRYLFDR